MDVKGFVSDFLSVVFPRNCVCCTRVLLKGEEFLCLFCSDSLTLSNFEQSDFLKQRFMGVPSVSYTYAFLKYIKGNATQKILYRIKYGDGKDLAYLLGQRYGQKLRDTPIYQHADFFIPVPLHKSKKRKRGFNQSEYFASGLAASLNKPVFPELMQRVLNNSTQTKKSRLERWLNVDRIFVVTDAHAVSGKHVVVVDDVITTGATLESCVEALIKAGAAKISIVSLAYAS
ncbi:phosphoribosyltransferase family protein [Cytophagaceae bacterium ABcell3]|nr:phosphoribosyltransferase family protein [Cytophagaceae bacterium ABcell3]